jgi:shikimate dehydrogenase
MASISLFDVNSGCCEALAQRLKDNHRHIEVRTGSNDPVGHDLVVNATPLGMNDGDPLPLDASRLSPETFVGEVVMRAETTAFLAAAQARGCRTQVGTDMLYEQIPAYLEFFGLPTTTADVLRRVAQLSY